MLLELRSVSKRFGGTVALDCVDWAVEAREVHCLIGENGSGKSTLIKIISGVYGLEAGGEILLDGKRVGDLDPNLSRSLGIEVIFQDLSLFPNLSVYENIALDFQGSNPFALIKRSAMRATAQAALDRVGARLSLDARVGSLSVSQRQLVAICRSLAKDARLLFMDEPTASLTRQEVEHLFDVVRRLKDQGVSIVFVSHRLDEILDIADRVTVIRDGKKVSTMSAVDMTEDILTEQMTGERIKAEFLTSGTTDGPCVLEVRDLSRLGEFERLNMSLHEGEVLGIVGLLGAGRTEFALSLFGMTQPHSGEIILDGQPVRFASNREAIARGLAYVSEDRLSLGLHLGQPIYENIALTVLDRLKGFLGIVTGRKREQVGADWSGKLGVKAASVKDAVSTLSGGNQQRVVLSKWLATNPRILILDSPTIGVDIKNKKAIYEIIQALALEKVSVIMISDELNELYFNANRILHMADGKICGEYRPQDMTREEITNAIYA